MTLGAAIFASVVLVLLVYNKPFRKASAWVAGVLTGLLLVGALGWYTYVKYQEHVQVKEAAAHKKLVDDCIARFSSSGYINSGPWAKYINVPGSCESDPNTDWSSKAKLNPDAPHASVIEIHGGETLKIVRTPNTNKNSQFDMTKSVPLIYLGHGQKFQLACGDFGEHSIPTEFPKTTKGMASCP
jgi:hypothetical protein